MSRSTEAAFSALKGLDPAEGATWLVRYHDPSEAAVEIEIERILALPRVTPAETSDSGHGRAWTELRHRPRYGRLGLIASAAIAVVATVVWVSPSAGAPLHSAEGGTPTVSPAHVVGHRDLTESAVVHG
jgi:hypothetical protein